MANDLFCPLGNNCSIYNKHSDYLRDEYAIDIKIKKIIRGATDGYSCRVLYRENSKNNVHNECALIQLLNNTEELLKLNKKE